MSAPATPLTLKDTIHWIILTLVKMARRREWGEIKITVQAGQILIVTEQVSHRDRLPQSVPGVDASEAQRHLAAVS